MDINVDGLPLRVPNYSKKYLSMYQHGQFTVDGG